MTPLRVHSYEWLRGKTTSWLKVPYKHILTLCLERQIGRWSKWQGEDVLLERHVDAQRFILAWEDFTREPFKFSGEISVPAEVTQKLKPYEKKR